MDFLQALNETFEGVQIGVLNFRSDFNGQIRRLDDLWTIDHAEIIERHARQYQEKIIDTLVPQTNVSISAWIIAIAVVLILLVIRR